MYEARYFADGNFLDSKLGQNPSFIWRSIWASKDLHMSGIRWRVGSGASINITCQPWLSDEDDPFISSELEVLKENKVYQVFNKTERCKKKNGSYDFIGRWFGVVLCVENIETSSQFCMIMFSSCINCWNRLNHVNLFINVVYFYLQIFLGITHRVYKRDHALFIHETHAFGQGCLGRIGFVRILIFLEPNQYI